MNESIWIWIGFNLFVVAAIFVDLVLLHRHTKVISLKHALIVSGIWIALALLFNVGILYFRGEEDALNFFAGYLIEKSLSIDNLFVFLTLFNYFRAPPEYQHKVLFWGILGAIVMRAIFIFSGIAIVHEAPWVLYIFAIFLLYASFKMIGPKETNIKLESNFVVNLLKKFLPITSDYVKDCFFVKKENRWWATPLFVVLLTVEMTDMVFAFDSIPAIMAITLDPFIVYTSNVFAILGLRSIYFALSSLVPLFHFLNYGLAAILGFVAIKMLIKSFVVIPIWTTLGFIATAIALSIAASLIFPKQSQH